MNCIKYLKIFFRFLIDCLLKKKDIKTLEKELLLSLSYEDINYSSEEAEIIEGIFKFRDTEVREILIPLPSMSLISINLDKDSVIRVISEKGFSRYPVYEEETRNIIGILNVKDLLIHISKSEQFNLKDILKPPYFIPQSKKISELLPELKQKKERMAIVVDEFGEVSGLVTQTDIIEEILGDLGEDDDSNTKGIKKDKFGWYEVSGTYPLDELSGKFEIDFYTEEKVETIAGYIIYKTGRIPEKSESLKIDDKIEVKILDADDRRIKKIQFRKI
ncbi:MAG: hemolysin family protein [Proteobacteria bacterium]|nr:hemolysin family protein [Pseudomonadota bacterium]